jgi:hypothetical protein
MQSESSIARLARALERSGVRAFGERGPRSRHECAEETNLKLKGLSWVTLPCVEEHPRSPCGVIAPGAYGLRQGFLIMLATSKSEKGSTFWFAGCRVME